MGVLFTKRKNGRYMSNHRVPYRLDMVLVRNVQKALGCSERVAVKKILAEVESELFNAMGYRTFTVNPDGKLEIINSDHIDDYEHEGYKILTEE